MVRDHRRGSRRRLQPADDEAHTCRQCILLKAQETEQFMSVAVRTQNAPASFTNAVRNAVLSVNKDIPIYKVKLMTDVVKESFWERGFFGTLFTAFGVIALFLASIGLYGVMSYSVRQRTQEIGIRIAFGAQARDVLAMVTRDGLRLIGVGLVVGFVSAYFVVQLSTRQSCAGFRARSAQFHNSAAHPARGRPGGVLFPGAFRHASRSGRSASLRVTSARPCVLPPNDHVERISLCFSNPDQEPGVHSHRDHDARAWNWRNDRGLHVWLTRSLSVRCRTKSRSSSFCSSSISKISISTTFRSRRRNFSITKRRCAVSRNSLRSTTPPTISPKATHRSESPARLFRPICFHCSA